MIKFKNYSYFIDALLKIKRSGQHTASGVLVKQKTPINDSGLPEEQTAVYTSLYCCLLRAFALARS